MNEYSVRLKYALAIRKMSQSDLARAVGVKPQAIQYLCEKGKRSVHSVKIADILKINPKWLTDGTGVIDDDASKDKEYQMLDWPNDNEPVLESNPDYKIMRMLKQIKLTLDKKLLTDEMAQDIVGYLKTKLPEK